MKPERVLLAGDLLKSAIAADDEETCVSMTIELLLGAAHNLAILAQNSGDQK